MYLKAYIQNLVENDPVVSEKYKFYMKLTSGQGQEMTLTLNTHFLPFTELIVCTSVLIFKPLATIVSEISNVFPFF